MVEQEREQEVVEIEEAPVAETVESEEEDKGDDLSDLFKGPGDVDTADLVEVSEADVMGDDGEADMSDLVEVTDEDLMGYEPKPKPKYRIIKRGSRVIHRPQPGASLGGINV